MYRFIDASHMLPQYKGDSERLFWKNRMAEGDEGRWYVRVGEAVFGRRCSSRVLELVAVCGRFEMGCFCTIIMFID